MSASGRERPGSPKRLPFNHNDPARARPGVVFKPGQPGSHTRCHFGAASSSFCNLRSISVVSIALRCISMTDAASARLVGRQLATSHGPR
jgi:hypothetical protein